LRSINHSVLPTKTRKALIGPSNATFDAFLNFAA
jgi:hypothetical protein